VKLQDEEEIDRRGFELLLIAGIPGTGKSTFGKWLQTEQGFVHIDLETDHLDQMGLRKAWEAFWPSRDLSSFPNQLARLSKPVVLDWGFPPLLLSAVANLKSAGADLCWFEGDRISARALCVKTKGPSAAAAFDFQIARIASAWALIAPLFGKIIQTVGPGGEIKQPAEVWDMITAFSTLTS
jgi:hypothetical protein